MNIKIRNLMLAGLVVVTSVVLSACGQKTTTPTGMNSVEFIKEVKLNEEFTVESNMGKMSYIVKEVGETDKIGGVNPITGQTFYYTIFDLKSDAGNDATKFMFDPALPQVVMLDKNALQSVGGAMGGSYNSDFTKEKGLTAYDMLKANEAKDWVHTATTWYTTKVDKPTVAVQYTDMQGSKQYIKVNY